MKKIKSVRLKTMHRVDNRGAKNLFSADPKSNGYEICDAIYEDGEGIPGIVICNPNGFDFQGKTVKIPAADILHIVYEDEKPKEEAKPPEKEPVAELATEEAEVPVKPRRGRPPKYKRLSDD